MQVVRRTMAEEHIFPDAPPSVEIGTAMSAEFTKGEMKVLRCLVRGLSYNEIAKELGIEPSTVKFHVINMLQKTNLENKLQLAIAATEAKFHSKRCVKMKHPGGMNPSRVFQFRTAPRHHSLRARRRGAEASAAHRG